MGGLAGGEDTERNRGEIALVTEGALNESGRTDAVDAGAHNGAGIRA
jgi:hypothetical protein